jgi:intracellular multiplication protein IcmP
MNTPSSGRATWASGDDYTLVSLIVIVGGLCIYAWVAWTNYHPAISRGFALLAHWHIEAIRLFTTEYDALDRQLLGADYSRVTLSGIQAAATSIGTFFRLPVALLLILLAGVCMSRASSSRFARRFDLDSLITEQARFFRTVCAFADRHLGLPPLDPREPRPADPALHPIEWLDRHGRLADGSVSKSRVRAELRKQLGPAWSAPAAAPPHVRLLFVAFALHLARQREDATRLLGDMAEALRGTDPDPALGPKASLIFPDHLVARADAFLSGSACAEASSLVANHAFAAPALMTLLTAARARAGVLPPAAFNGIKLVDRRLWYALQSLGFPSDGQGRDHAPNPPVEAIGARDHWSIEVALGAAVRAPSVDRAAMAILAFARPARPPGPSRS